MPDSDRHFDPLILGCDMFGTLVATDGAGRVVYTSSAGASDRPSESDLAGWADIGYITEPDTTVPPCNLDTDLTFAHNWATDPDRAAAQLEQQIRRAYEARTDTAPAPPGDVLDRIDAAVNQQCACGCRTPIGDASPSAYFASAACQSRWANRQATDPQDVYQRPDAAMYVGVDAARWPLNTAEAAAADVPPRLLLVAEPVDDPNGLAYLRYCGACRQWIQPRVFEDHDDISSFGDVGVIRTNTRLISECSNCEETLPGPSFVGHVHSARPNLLGGTGWNLTLGSDIGRVRRFLSRRDWARATDRRTLIACIWHDMEEWLHRFGQDWTGRRRRPAALRISNPT